MEPNDSNKNWNGKSRGGTLGYLSFVFLIKKFGVGAAYSLLAFVVIYYIPFAPKATSSIWMYSRKILENGRFKSLKFVYMNFFSLGQSIIDRVAVSSGKSNEYIFDFSEPDDVRKILNSPEGVVIIGAHFGNWEIGSPFFDKYSKEMMVVMMDYEYQNIKKILETQKKVDTFRVIPITDNSFSYLFEIRDALSKGKYIAIQGDRLSKSEKHLDMEFMGYKAAFPLGPFVLATRLNAPVVFYFAVRTGYKRYKFEFALARDYSCEAHKMKEVALMKDYVATLERVVQEYPEQWYNYYNFWNT
ncbi:MAG: hypothetical protein A2X18_11855 [Bacteroidetes bacterium GWF2_40_14]|nr:MAG: hypothetical protein A2X18_11855 [Bacteroidetes bacterium GWF2_40_14]